MSLKTHLALYLETEVFTIVVHETNLFKFYLFN